MSRKPTINNRQFLYNLYKPLFIVMLICGYNYFTTRNLLKRIIFNIYTIFLVVIITYSNMTCCPSQEISFVWAVLEYSVFVIIMIFHKSNVYIYLQRLLTLDIYLRINRRHYYRTRSKIYICVILIWLIGLSYILGVCSTDTCLMAIPTFLVYEFSILALDVNRVWRYVLFEEIWRRLKLLRTRMEEDPDANYYLYVKDNKMVKENKLKFCLKLYKCIADLLDLISPELNASLFVSICCSLPKLIINVYRVLLVIDKILPKEMLGFQLLNIFQTCAFIFAPSFVVELCKHEVEMIRHFLVHRLMTETDDKTKADIQLFLQYTSIRDFKYKVWRAIPMDLSLPLDIINLCTTYVIVMVNFTKVFDK